MLKAPLVVFSDGVGNLVAIVLPMVEKNEFTRPAFSLSLLTKESSAFLSGPMGLRTLELVASFNTFH